MIRFVLLVVFVYLLLRMLTRMFSKAPKSGGFRAQKPPPRRDRPPPGPPRIVDEMKPCPSCGTFNPTRLAYEKKGLYFCDQRCHEAYIRGEKPA